MSSDDFFSGGVFSDAIEGGRSGAEIRLSRQEITARTPEGQQFAVPYRQCQVEMGGFSGRMVFCRTPDRALTIFCEDRRFPAALAEAAVGLLDEQIRQSLVQRRRDAWRGRQLAVLLALALALLVVGGYFAVRAAARAAAHALPVSVDRSIGAAAFQSMDLGGPEVHDPLVVGPLQAIVDRLAPHATIEGLQFKVHVIDSPLVNAFALPGGTIVVYTGLIRAAADAEQVAGVLAHEMSHAALRHGLQRVSQSIGVVAAVQLLLGDVQGLIATGAELFQLATINSYSREQENAADEEGVRMLVEADIDPRGLVRFFEALKKEHGDLPGMAGWLSTHPQTEARIAAVEAQIAAAPARQYRPIEVDWAAMRQRVGK